MVTLEITFNSIKLIENKTFETLTNLRNLYLPYNKIEEIGSGAFDSLKKLGTLDLSFNKLKKVDRSWFQNLQALRYLLLNGNDIKEVSAELFSNLPDLGSLDLSRNKIIKLSTTFADTNLKDLDLSCMNKDNEAILDANNVLIDYSKLPTLKKNPTDCGQCKVPDIVNGTFLGPRSANNEVKEFTRFKIQCNPGFFLSSENNDEEWSCWNGVLDKILPKCHKGGFP